MKQAMVILCLVFGLASCAMKLNEPAANPVSGSPYTWDFGKVKEGLVLKHTFVFKNVSKKTVTIKDINTSCGCTTSEVKKKVLLPKEKTFIEVSFNSLGYAGPVEQYVYVNTDGLDNPILKYIIKAEVVK